MRKEGNALKNADVAGVLLRHGDDNFSLWQPENAPCFADFMETRETDGGSVRGNGAEILAEVRSALGMSAPEVHVIVYADGGCRYVGMDVFDSFDAALAQYNRRLKETRDDNPDNPGRVTELEHDETSGALHFRDRSGYEVFYRRETIQQH